MAETSRDKGPPRSLISLRGGKEIITSTFQFRIPRAERDLFNQHLEGLTQMSKNSSAGLFGQRQSVSQLHLC